MNEKYPDQVGTVEVKRTFDTSPDMDSCQSELSSSFHSPSSSDGSPILANDGDFRAGSANKLGKNSPSFAYRFREHVRLGSKISDTVMGKLSLGAKVIQKGGREKIFKEVFGVREGELLLKASQCYLSTTAGPIAGLLFISTKRISFSSERAISIPASNGDLVRTPYKVSIPLEKIKRADRSENAENPLQKYIEIVTNDGFEFWFLGFLRYEKAFKNLEKALSMVI